MEYNLAASHSAAELFDCGKGNEAVNKRHDMPTAAGKNKNQYQATFNRFSPLPQYKKFCCTISNRVPLCQKENVTFRIWEIVF